MVADFTTGILNNTGKVLSTDSPKSYTKTDGTKDFSDVFENVSKNYADKNIETKGIKDNSYARQTKDVQSVKTDLKSTSESADENSLSDTEKTNEDSLNINQDKDETETSEDSVSLDDTAVYADTAAVQSAEILSTKDIDVEIVADADILENNQSVSNIQNTTENNVSSKSYKQTSVLPVETIVENLKMESDGVENTDNSVESVDFENVDNEIDIEIKNVSDSEISNEDFQSTKNTNSKDNVSNDISRVILNLDEQSTDDINSVLPKDTAVEQEPVIKVSADVVTDSKTATATDYLENKDVSGSAKDRAVSQMTELQGTDTTVTDMQSDSQQNNSADNGQSTGQNANEQVAKMAVENIQIHNSFSGASAEKFDSSLVSKLAQNQPQQTLNQADIMSQVNSKLADLQNSGNNKVSIVLNPENLGRVVLEIQNTGDGIVAKMSTDNQQVKEMFDKNIDALRANLNNQGVNVNNIKVECTEQSHNNAMNFEREQFSQSSFNDSQKHNNNTQHSNDSTGQSKHYFEDAESDFDYSNTGKIQNHKTIIEHNGKVDYKV